MSLATRCPECSTTFRVVPDQLRVSDGWVRCGRCSRVFDANDHMVVAAAPQPVPASSQDDPSPDDDPPWSAAPAGAAPWQGLPSLELGAGPVAERVDPSWSPSGFGAASAPKSSTAPEARVEDTEAPRAPSASVANDAVRPGPEAASGRSEGVSFVVRTPSESADAGASDFSFLGPAVDSAIERRRRLSLRIALVALALVAALVLVAQVLARSHDAIAAREPSLRPAMLAWCRLAGCTVSPLRQLDDIAIDGSAFVREKSNEGYLLSFTLRNRSGLPLAMPSIELSLLDTKEQPVLRRVLRPADFGAPAVLSARGEHAATLPLALAPSQVEALQPRIAGYHLDPFYP